MKNWFTEELYHFDKTGTVLELLDALLKKDDPEDLVGFHSKKPRGHRRVLPPPTPVQDDCTQH